MSENNISGYQWNDSALIHVHSLLLPVLDKILESVSYDKGMNNSLFDLGCGYGSAANYLPTKVLM